MSCIRGGKCAESAVIRCLQRWHQILREKCVFLCVVLRCWYSTLYGLKEATTAVFVGFNIVTFNRRFNVIFVYFNRASSVTSYNCKICWLSTKYDNLLRLINVWSKGWDFNSVENFTLNINTFPFLLHHLFQKKKLSAMQVEQETKSLF